MGAKTKQTIEEKEFSTMFENVKLNDGYWEQDIRISIALSLLDFLDDKKITQKALAKRMGCQKSNISKLLCGDNDFTIGTLAKISKALNVDVKLNFVSKCES